MSVERVREILKISQEPVSLETPIGEEEDSHLGDFIQDDNEPVPADAAAFTMLKEQLEAIVCCKSVFEGSYNKLFFTFRQVSFIQESFYFSYYYVSICTVSYTHLD